MGTGLPSFAGLVDHVYEAARIEKDDAERIALDLRQSDPVLRHPKYDKVLGLLERSTRVGAEQVRRIVVERLSVPPAGSLDVHRALLTLSRSESGVRLVTTNFDARFEQATIDELQIDSCPKLPVPKPHSWNSLVHLHGRIAPKQVSSDLVLTAADFGRAYLTERWASRFVTELFREFTVVFVGYSLDDPVMAYMVDALAAERQRGGGFNIAYAFAEYDDLLGGASAADSAWRAKNVEPILFDRTGNYQALSGTLIAWAEIAQNPFRARKNIALEELSKLPAGPNDPIVERVAWALQDPAAAEALANSAISTQEEDYPKIEAWLECLREKGLFSRPKNKGLSPALDANSIIVGTPFASEQLGFLDTVGRLLGYWISRHLHIPHVLRWVLHQGGYIHPQVQDFVRRQLAQPDTSIPDRLRLFWTILLNETHWTRTDLIWAVDQYKISSSPDEKRVLAGLLVRHFKPRLTLKEGMAKYIEYGRATDHTAQPPGPLETCAHLELSVGSDDDDTLVLPILREPGFLAEHALTLTSYLEHAIDLLAGPELYRSLAAFELPSVAPHEQNNHRDEWTILVDLVRDAHYQLSEVDRRQSDNLLGRWLLHKDSIFKRLSLNAITEDEKADIEHARTLLLANRSRGLWDQDLHREVLRFLRIGGGRLPPGLRKELIAAISKGPPRRGGKSGRKQYEIKLRLSKLAQAGALKGKALADFLPLPTDDVAERDEFLFWTSGGWTSEDERGRTDLRSMLAGELATSLQGRKIDADAFEGLVLEDPTKAVAALRTLSNQASWPELYWERLLWMMSRPSAESQITDGTVRDVAALLTNAPPELLGDIGLAVAGFVEALARTWGPEAEADFRRLWTLAWAGVPLTSDTNDRDSLTRALNHAAGKLAEAALLRVAKYDPKRNEGLPKEALEYMERVAQDRSASLGRVIFATRLHYLFQLDPSWTRSKLLPLFDFDHSNEAADLWAGFAWSPRMGPTLLAAMKDSLLKAVERYEALGRRGTNLINLFLAISLDVPDGFAREDVNKLIAALPEAGLVRVLRELEGRFQGEPSERRNEWIKNVQPWLQSYWPTAAARNTPKTSEAFISLILATGQGVPDAVRFARDYLKPITEGLYRLRKSDALKLYPDAIYEMLQKVIDHTSLVSWEKGTLASVLDRLEEVTPSITGDPKFGVLKRIATGT